MGSRGRRVVMIAVVDSGVSDVSSDFEGQFSSRGTASRVIDKRDFIRVDSLISIAGSFKLQPASVNSSDFWGMVDLSYQEKSNGALEQSFRISLVKVPAASYALWFDDVPAHSFTLSKEAQILDFVFAAGSQVSSREIALPEQHPKIYGGIASPGNHPEVITVGAVDTRQTDGRGDDTVAPYSSRGPTLVDGLVKPELVAPGSKLISIRSWSGRCNYLTSLYPFWGVTVGNDHNSYMLLNGTSVSAGVVSGAAALMLEKNPSLTPAMVKALLMYTAQKLPGLSIQKEWGALMLDPESTRYVNTESVMPYGVLFNTPPLSILLDPGSPCYPKPPAP